MHLLLLLYLLFLLLLLLLLLQLLTFVVMASSEDLEANSEFIKKADFIVPVPGGPSRENYGNVSLICDIAVKQKVRYMQQQQHLSPCSSSSSSSNSSSSSRSSIRKCVLGSLFLCVAQFVLFVLFCFIAAGAHIYRYIYVSICISTCIICRCI